MLAGSSEDENHLGLFYLTFGAMHRLTRLASVSIGPEFWTGR